MLRLLSDENFNGDIVRGLLLRRPGIDLIRTQDVGLRGADDTQVLQWAAEDVRILLTHDRATMPAHAAERINMGLAMPGVFVIGSRLPVGQVIDELLLIDACSDPSEWDNRVLFLPL